MRPTAALALLLLVLPAGACTQGAAAQSGNGLYEPFPEAAVKKRAQRYVDRLRARTAEPDRRYSDRELSAGVFVRAGRHGPSLAPASGARDGAASARSGGATEPGELAMPLQLLLLSLSLAVPAGAVARRTRTPRGA